MYRFDQGNLQNVPDYASDMERDNARFEIEMRRLQASNQYNEASTEKRYKMEAQLVAMKEGYLPAGMAQNLIGVPEYNGQPNNGANPRMGTPGMIGAYPPSQEEQAQMNTRTVREGDGVGGFVGGALGGVVGSSAGNTFRGAMGQGLGNAGDNLTRAGSMADEVLKKASSGTLNKTDDFLKNTKARPGSVFEKLRTGVGKGGLKTAANLDSLALKGVGKSSSKAVGSVLGKIGGQVAGKAAIGAAIGGIPGFLIGTAIGAAIEKLMEGDEKDQAKAQFMLSQYK